MTESQAQFIERFNQGEQKMTESQAQFIESFNEVAYRVVQNAFDKGFREHGAERNIGEELCLIHSEVSEALEGIRRGNPTDDKISQFSSAEAELADAVIRAMDTAYARGWRLAEAIIAKHEYNLTRPRMHGKMF